MEQFVTDKMLQEVVEEKRFSVQYKKGEVNKQSKAKLHKKGMKTWESLCYGGGCAEENNLCRQLCYNSSPGAAAEREGNPAHWHDLDEQDGG